MKTFAYLCALFLLVFSFSPESYAYLSPRAVEDTTSFVEAENGSVGTPSISFVNSADAGLYRIGANDIGLAVAGILGIEAKKATGSYINAGIGGPASTSNSIPLYLKRSVAGATLVIAENEGTTAGDGVKYQLKAASGASVFEFGLFTTATAAPDAYVGGMGTLRCTDSCPGISAISDGAATGNFKFYMGGNGAGNLVMTVDQFGLKWGTLAAKPTCDSSARGREYFTPGGSGAADILQMCMKGTLNTYSWVTVVTAL